jgi:hypothetical protein
MKYLPWLLLPIALVAVAAILFAQFRSMGGTFSTSNIAAGYCQSNDDIAPATREEIGRVALTFIEHFEQSPVEARLQMSARGRAATMQRGPLENAAAAYRSVETSGSRAVSETYLLRYSSGSETGAHVPCDLIGGRAIFIGRGGTSTSAVVLLKDDLPGRSERTTSVWLEHEGGAWRVRAFVASPSTIVGRNAEQLWTAAREQRAKGNDFNAAMLYAAARSAQQLGPYYQGRLSQDFNSDLRTFTAPGLLQGEAPHAWNFEGETFSVTQVQYTGFGSGEVALTIEHTIAPGATNEVADLANRRLIDGLNAAYPEWREVFDAIGARSHRPDSNQTWGTVFSRTTGYTAPLPDTPE